MQARTFLFLQGAPSLFGRDLSIELERLGHRTLRINLCLGDRLVWPRRGAFNYRGRLEDWRAYLSAFVAREGVTDILYYADRLPYHVIAGEVARDARINAIAYEFGYLRPDWITLEHGGMSAYSHFPADPAAIRARAAGLPEPDFTPKYPFPHGLEAAYEVVYNIATYFDLVFHPHYVADRIHNPVLEYVSHLPRIALTRRNNRRSQAVLQRLLDDGTDYYLFPLQIDSDYQLRANTPFRNQKQAVAMTMRSFAEHAPEGSVLLFKQHPLDNALTHWKTRIRRMARTWGVSDRVRFIRAGDLKAQLQSARGAVVINSTVGIHALRYGRPLQVLGVALYDIEGLTHQDGLDSFWTEAAPPDPGLCEDFMRLLAAATQVRGNFYSRAGRKAGARAAAARLSDGRVNQPGGYEPVPPRLAEARRRGVKPADELGRQIRQTGPAEPATQDSNCRG